MKTMTPKQRDRIDTAVHEAGHAVLSEVFPALDQQGCTVKPGEANGQQWRGLAWFNTDEARVPDRNERDWQYAVACAGGGAATARQWGRVASWHDAGLPDYQGAYWRVQRIANTVCMSRSLPPMDKLMLGVMDAARKAVDANWGDIKAVARALLRHQTLTGDQVRKAMSANRLTTKAANYEDLMADISGMRRDLGLDYHRSREDRIGLAIKSLVTALGPDNTTERQVINELRLLRATVVELASKKPVAPPTEPALLAELAELRRAVAALTKATTKPRPPKELEFVRDPETELIDRIIEREVADA